MKFSTRTTYGLRAMISLGQNHENSSLPLSVIARKEKISKSYLERLFAKLKKAGLIISEKGTAGGYKLSKAPKNISVYEIIKTLEGKMTPFYCLGEDGKIYCESKYRCGATKVLAEVQQAVNSTLKSMSLSDLL